MISFLNPKFHENIVKKYSRVIRKSYFSDLFFKQDYKSSDKTKNHIFTHIKFNFSNTLFCKKLTKNSLNNKQHESQVFPLKLNIVSLKFQDNISNSFQRKEKQAHVELFDSSNFKSIDVNLKPKENSQIRANKVEMPTLPDSINTSRALPSSRMILNTNFFSSVHFRIRKFLENEAFFFYREYLANTAKTRISLNIVQQQQIDEIHFFRKGRIQTLSAGEMFLAKNEIVVKNTSEKFIKNLFTLKNWFLQEDTQGFPDLYRKLGPRILNLIESHLFISKSWILGIGYASRRSESTWWDRKSKRSNSYKRTGNTFFKFFTSSPQEYPKTITELFIEFFDKVPTTSIAKQTEKLQSSLKQSVLKLNSLYNPEIKSSRHAVIGAFNWVTAFTKNTSTVSQHNRQVSRTSSSTEVFRLKEQEINNLESTIFAPCLNAVIMPASTTSTPIFKRLRVLLSGNKLTNIIGAHKIGSLEHIVKENKYYYLYNQLRKAFKLPEVLLSCSTILVEDGKPVHLWKIPIIRECNDTSLNTSEQLVLASSFTADRVFKKLATLKSDIVERYIFNFEINYKESYKAVYSAGIKKAYFYLQSASRVLNCASIREFSKILRNPKVPKSTCKVTPAPYYSAAYYPTNDHTRAGNRLSGTYAADNYTAYNRNVGNIRELRKLKRKRHYSLVVNKLLSTITQPVFLKSLETNSFRSGKTEALLYRNKQSSISDKAEVPKLGMRKAYAFSSQQKFPLYLKSIYIGAHPATGDLNNPATHTKSYPAVASHYIKSSPLNSFNHLNSFTNLILNLKTCMINYKPANNYIRGKTRSLFAIINNDHMDKISFTGKRILFEKRSGLALSNLRLSSSGKGTSTPFPKKDVLEFFKIMLSPLGVNTPAETEYITTLKRPHNSVIGSKLSSYGSLPRRFLDSSVTLLSENAGTASRNKVISLLSVPLFGLSKYASFVISHNRVFARKPGVKLNTEAASSNKEWLIHITTSISYVNERQKLTGHKAPSRKTPCISLCCAGEKKENSNTGDFLLRCFTNPPGEKNNLQVNKNTEIIAKLSAVIGVSHRSVFSVIPDFTQGRKWKNVFSISPKQEKKSELVNDIFDRFSLKLKSLKSSEKTAKSHIYSGTESTSFAYSGERRISKISGITSSITSGKGRSELMHVVESMRKTGREDLAYDADHTLIEEVKKIEKIAFETKEAVADHLETHLQQATEKVEQFVDIEQISDKVMQMITRRLKIEFERRGVF